MSTDEARAEDVRRALFPPMVSFDVFVSALQRLADVPPTQRESVLSDYPRHDRSQLSRTLAFFDIRPSPDRYNEIALRRLADPERRPAALRKMLRANYAPALSAIDEGIDRVRLEGMLAVPERDSASSRQKARQFLERAMEAAGMSRDGIRTAPRSPASAKARSAKRSVVAPAPNPVPRQSASLARYVTQQESYLDLLLDRYRDAVDEERAQQLEAHIEAVSSRLDRLLGHGV